MGAGYRFADGHFADHAHDAEDENACQRIGCNNTRTD